MLNSDSSNAADNVINIAVDAMGGDLAPTSVIEGLEFFLLNLLPDNITVRFNIYGQEEKVLPILSEHKNVLKHSTFFNAPDVVVNTDKPSLALRNRRNSSMWLSINSVKTGESSGIISSGNTGALMAISRCILGTLPNIHRPAIATVFPSKFKKFVLLDLGANIDCNADSLFQFAIMGSAFAKATIGIQNPAVALLNIGSEDTKGTDSIKGAFALLNKIKSQINFKGYIEAQEIFQQDNIDVLVTDGFTGNVMLKTIEGMGSAVVDIVKNSISSSFITKFILLLLKSKFNNVLNILNPKHYNGAMLLGLNGVVIKSHGNSDKLAFASAVKVTVNTIYHNVNDKIISELANTES